MLHKTRVAIRFPAKKPRVAFRLSYLSIELFYIGKSVVQIDGQARSSDYSSYEIFLPTVFRCEWESPANTGNKQKRNICDHKVQPECLHKATFTNTFHLFFLLFPTTLCKKRYDVTVLVNEFLFSYHSQLRMPLAWSRGDEVSVFSSTQVLKEDPFCLNPVLLLQKNITESRL